jgi:hypothetical protein
MTCRVTRFTCAKGLWPWRSPDVAHTRVTWLMREKHEKSETCESRTSLQCRTCRAYSRVSLLYRTVEVPSFIGASCSTQVTQLESLFVPQLDQCATQTSLPYPETLSTLFYVLRRVDSNTLSRRSEVALPCQRAGHTWDESLVHPSHGDGIRSIQGDPCNRLAAGLSPRPFSSAAYVYTR